MIYKNCTTEVPSPTNCAGENILPKFIPDLSIIDAESTRAGMTTVDGGNRRNKFGSRRNQISFRKKKKVTHES